MRRHYNPSISFSEAEAQELAREFHGRENRDTEEFVVEHLVPPNLAKLGSLIELQVWVGDAPEVGDKVTGRGVDFEYLPITFAPEYPNEEDEATVRVASTKEQIYFIGGDQEFDVADFVEKAGLPYGEDDLDVDSIALGPVKAIAYFADKHHLEGPRSQKKGIPYQHEFGIDESNGEVIHEFPILYYYPRQKQFKLIGGNYEILPEGISG